MSKPRAAYVYVAKRIYRECVSAVERLLAEEEA